MASQSAAMLLNIKSMVFKSVPPGTLSINRFEQENSGLKQVSCSDCFS